MNASLTYRKRRYQKQLEVCKRMRAAKARYRLERDYVEPEPRMRRWHRFEFRVRDRLTGEVSGWYELTSVRDLSRRTGVLLRHLP